MATAGEWWALHPNWSKNFSRIPDISPAGYKPSAINNKAHYSMVDPVGGVGLRPVELAFPVGVIAKYSEVTAGFRQDNERFSP